MEIPLRGLSHVKYNTFRFIVKNWKSVLSLGDKIGLTAIALLLVLTSATWVFASSQSGNLVPKAGGNFVEGVVSSSVDNVDLGRLTKSGLVKIDDKGEIVPDLAIKWESTEDRLNYKVNLVNSISSYEILDVIKKNPTYLPTITPTAIDLNTLNFELKEANVNFLYELAQPIFPYGPYKVDKKTDTEIRLKRNQTYHSTKPLFDKFIVRIYQDQDALQNAANKNRINGAIGLKEQPKKWDKIELALTRKHMLFINSSKTYLKKTKVREQLLNGEKPETIKSLDILEVNGVKTDQAFEDFKAKLTQAGIEVKVRKVSLKDALKDDLPKRNYDLLYILINEGLKNDPYVYYNSTQRSGVGQNFAELANADVDILTESLRKEIDPAKGKELTDQISKLIAEEKVMVEYPKISETYYFSQKTKGLSIEPLMLCETDRFALISIWHFFEKRSK